MTMRPLSMQIIDAVLAPECPLRLEVRALVVVMAYLADRKTAIGLKSQATIAQHLRTSDRNVRRLEAEVSSTLGSPVAIVRRARQRKDGRGRTSDAYQIILTEAEPTGRHVPDGQEDQADGTVRVEDSSEARPTGRNRQDQPDEIARPTGPPGPTIQSVDPVSDPVSTSCAPQADAREQPQALALEVQEASMAKPKPRTRPGKPKAETPARKARKPEDTAAFNEVRAVYFEAFEAARGEKPLFGKPEGGAIKRLIGKCGGAEKACGMIRQIYAPGAYWRDKCTVLDFQTNVQKYTAPPGNGTSTTVVRQPRQPNHGRTGWERRQAS